jgi:DNA-binding XRE family transcriptional regulator
MIERLNCPQVKIMPRQIALNFPIDFFGPTELGKIIRAIRKFRKLTQYEVSQLTNLSARFISNVENGKMNTHLEKVLLILRVLDVGTQLTDLKIGSET